MRLDFQHNAVILNNGFEKEVNFLALNPAIFARDFNEYTMNDVIIINVLFFIY